MTTIDPMLHAIVLDGPLKDHKLTIRYGDSQMDGQWEVIEVELLGRMVPFRLALQVLRSPEAF